MRLVLLFFLLLVCIEVLAYRYQPDISCKDLSGDSAKVSGSIQHSKQCKDLPWKK